MERKEDKSYLHLMMVKYWVNAKNDKKKSKCTTYCSKKKLKFVIRRFFLWPISSRKPQKIAKSSNSFFVLLLRRKALLWISANLMKLTYFFEFWNFCDCFGLYSLLRIIPEKYAQTSVSLVSLPFIKFWGVV